MTEVPVLVIDGDCGICTASGRWIARRVHRVRVATHIDMGLAPIEKVQFRDGERISEGADAVALVLRASDVRILRAVGVTISLPIMSVLARWVYAIVARNRSRLSRFFGVAACTLAADDKVSEPRRSAEASSDAATTA